METILVRKIAPTDAEKVAQLSAELGYPVQREEMKERIALMDPSGNGIVYVATISSQVIAWIDVCIIHHLSTGAYVEIGGLIVSKDYRSRGIGRELIARAEQWAIGQGITRIIVRSLITRQDTHRFYLREGYSMTKTSAVFSKQLNE